MQHKQQPIAVCDLSGEYHCRSSSSQYRIKALPDHLLSCIKTHPLPWEQNTNTSSTCINIQRTFQNEFQLNIWFCPTCKKAARQLFPKGRVTLEKVTRGRITFAYKYSCKKRRISIILATSLSKYIYIWGKKAKNFFKSLFTYRVSGQMWFLSTMTELNHCNRFIIYDQ